MVRAVLPGVLALVLLGACGSRQGSSPITEGTSEMPSTDPSEPVEDLTLLPTSKPGKGSLVTLSGTLAPGVEAGCHLLSSAGSTYQLIWDRGALVDGERVEVVGTAQPDVMTTCQQGIPFVVERLTLLDDRTP